MYQKWGFGSLESEHVKIVCYNPKRYFPAWICVCWCITCQNKSVERFCVQRKKERNKEKIEW